jgi:hypothetical protein
VETPTDKRDDVLGEFQPKLNATRRDCRFLFLGNASPAVQLLRGRTGPITAVAPK